VRAAVVTGAAEEVRSIASVAGAVLSAIRRRAEATAGVLTLGVGWDRLVQSLAGLFTLRVRGGQAAGMAAADAVKRAGRVVSAALPVRAARVGETEAHAALNGGGEAARVELGLGKKWIAVDDERTRPTHAAADGQVVPAGAYFTVGGFPALYPGDPRLPVGERINCRCVAEGVPL
jgi:hypothetical protein